MGSENYVTGRGWLKTQPEHMSFPMSRPVVCVKVSRSVGVGAGTVGEQTSFPPVQADMADSGRLRK